MQQKTKKKTKKLTLKMVSFYHKLYLLKLTTSALVQTGSSLATPARDPASPFLGRDPDVGTGDMQDTDHAASSARVLNWRPKCPSAVSNECKRQDWQIHGSNTREPCESSKGCHPQWGQSSETQG